MAIEMRELHIRINVNQQSGGNQQNAAGTTEGSKDNNEELLQQCVEQVLHIIDNKKER
jgi:hypothetical protein